jgi:hypothetical protein
VSARQPDGSWKSICWTKAAGILSSNDRILAAYLDALGVQPAEVDVGELRVVECVVDLSTLASEVRRLAIG